MCGEQWRHYGSRSGNGGSPPRVRGTARSHQAKGPTTRITPACAGNSIIPTRSSPASKDHPRVCGEQSNGGTNGSSQGGSPPRVRGTGPGRKTSFAPCRITPACAGNSFGRGRQKGGAADHPRVCGEQIFPPWACLRPLGSPPRVRGTDGPKLGHVFTAGITPACAGNSHPPILWKLEWLELPRVCGAQ